MRRQALNTYIERLYLKKKKNVEYSTNSYLDTTIKRDISSVIYTYI